MKRLSETKRERWRKECKWIQGNREQRNKELPEYRKHIEFQTMHYSVIREFMKVIMCKENSSHGLSPATVSLPGDQTPLH